MKIPGLDTIWLRSIAFVLANLLLLIAIFFAFISPMKNFFSQREAQITEKRMLFLHSKSFADQQAAVQDLTRKMETTKDDSEFLRGSSQNVVSADLQTRLKSIIETAGARLHSIRGLQSQTKDRIQFIGAEVEISGPIRAIHQTIYAMESARPLLFVTSADIKTSSLVYIPLNKSETESETALDVRLEISGALQLDGER
jgi:general secretion pathway protein M